MNAALASGTRVVLLDEPSAHLHPSAVRTQQAQIVRASTAVALGGGGHVVVEATHRHREQGFKAWERSTFDRACTLRLAGLCGETYPVHRKGIPVVNVGKKRGIECIDDPQILDDSRKRTRTSASASPSEPPPRGDMFAGSLDEAAAPGAWLGPPRAAAAQLFAPGPRPDMFSSPQGYRASPPALAIHWPAVQHIMAPQGVLLEVVVDHTTRAQWHQLFAALSLSNLPHQLSCDGQPMNILALDENALFGTDHHVELRVLLNGCPLTCSVLSEQSITFDLREYPILDEASFAELMRFVQFFGHVTGRQPILEDGASGAPS